MPKLLVFAPCEKVIISQDENNPTLIAILTAFTLQTDAESLKKAIGESTSADAGIAMVPLRWSVFCLWQREPSDGEQEFTQTIDIEAPGGDRVIISHRNTFSFTPAANTHRINLNFPGFPVGEPGVYTIRLSLDSKPIADYALELKLAPQTTEAATTS